ncbi:MAG: WD40 repeat domain-containing protein, partial [Lachnospiraceae bacterium]|nr:WD40 repeat domain-containing protein [Lachnospiraceae bacterium]
SCLFAQFSHDGKYVITYDGSTDSHMNLVDLTTGNILRTLERDNGLSTYSLVGDGTEQYAFIQRDYPTSDKDLGEDYLPGTVTYYNMTDGSVTDTIKPAWVEEHASVDLLGITTDREHFIVRTTEKYDRVVKRINLRTNEEENKWYLPDGYSNSYAMAEDGTFAVTINSDDQTLNKFAVSGDPEKDRQAVTSISINAAFSTELFISSDGKYVGVGYQDHSAEIYLAEDLTLVRSFDSLDYTPDAMGLSDNGYYLHVTLGAYFMDDELNLKCWVGGFKELLPGGKEAYVTGTYGDIFKTPLYSLKELIQQAHALLDAKAEMTGNEE